VWVQDQEHVHLLKQLNPGQIPEQRDILNKRQKQQRVRNQIGQKHPGRERRRAPEISFAQRERRRHADQHRDGHTKIETIAEFRKNRRSGSMSTVERSWTASDETPTQGLVAAEISGAAFSEVDQHVERRDAARHREHGQEKIRPAERPGRGHGSMQKRAIFDLARPGRLCRLRTVLCHSGFVPAFVDNRAG